LFPEILNELAVRPLIRKLFESANSEFRVIVPDDPIWIVSPGTAAAMRSRKVPAPLSARLVTVSGAEKACGDTAAAANVIVRNAQALEYLNIVSIKHL
jgi:hypothetical protein